MVHKKEEVKTLDLQCLDSNNFIDFVLLISHQIRLRREEKSSFNYKTDTINTMSWWYLLVWVLANISYLLQSLYAIKSFIYNLKMGSRILKKWLYIINMKVQITLCTKINTCVVMAGEISQSTEWLKMIINRNVLFLCLSECIALSTFCSHGGL